MQPTVTAVLVARNGAKYLPRTLAALAAQTRRPDRVIPVDAGSSDATARLLSEAFPARLVSTPGRRTFGAAVSAALQSEPAPESPDDWLWLLGHDNAPAPDALATMLGAVEIAPSVAVAGPKLMRWDDAAVIASFGETVTTLGRSVELVSGELDQAQHDSRSDILAVAAGGMLVRRRVWTALGGFDPALPSVDAALDFCVRARLAGHRVVGVAGARVASAGPPELFGRRSVSAGAQNRIRRAAQLHRRLVWAKPAAVPLHWLTLVPLAVLRSLGHLVAKRPGWVGGELAAGLAAAFDTGVAPARRTLRRNRQFSWAAVDPLRMRWAEVRERRAAERAALAPAARPRERVGFFLGGGAWVVLVMAIVGVVSFGRFVGADAIAGGGLLPLSATVGELWSHVGVGWHDIGAGFFGAADPFAALLAVLGTLAFWAPSFSVVLLYLVAMPLAALAAWWCAARFARGAWGPAIAALGWALAPPFLASLDTGHLGAVIAHVLLPTLVLAVVNAARSWSMSAVAALLFAAVAASAPSIVPALVVGIVAWAVVNPRGALRVLGIPLPAAALFAPLVIEQLARGNWLALFADPGLPVVTTAPSALHLAVGGGLAGWDGLLSSLGLDTVAAPIVVVVLLAPFAVLAVLGAFLPGAARGIPALVVALLGFVTAVTASHIEVTIVGAATTPIWPGAGLSLYWLGLLGAAAASLDALRRAATVPALVATLGLVLLAVPGITAAASGATATAPSNGRLLPAFAAAEAAARPGLGTLQLTAQPEGGAAVALHRGQGTTLDEQSTLAATDTRLDDAEARLAVLAGNLASRSGFEITGELDDLQIAFVLLTNGDGADQQRIAEALDGNRNLTPIGATASGTLWYYSALAEGDAPSGPGPASTTLGVGVLVAQGIVFGFTLLLAIPTTRRRRVRSAKADAESGTEETAGESR
ncbi:glycosyltransferase family 2 protein [Leifsonia sp. H3M29-4]|uniref:glycosyltransferase family 2 protein n=1 Tax=Salinibacterium metalliresistens TaxID=3031321 RepID=UPI0023DB06D7|nr:glycosyltransferase family 2 protein [Salinibacterium metalliresistens]MDF1479181.1 glycosyltransferase family 2 protein [Salinibacterium metalliresistens]